MPSTKVARLKNGDLMLAGEVNERLPAIRKGLHSHYPFDCTANKYIPVNIRYIRDWLNGNTKNVVSHWVEIQAFDLMGTNIALGKLGKFGNGSIQPALTNGNTSTAEYVEVAGKNYAEIDLGDLYEIAKIRSYHYYADGRSYYETKIEVSDDGVNWYSIFDSAIEGIYTETSAGKTVDLYNPGQTVAPLVNTNTSFMPDGSGLDIYEGTTNHILIDGESTPMVLNSDNGARYIAQCTEDRLFGKYSLKVYNPTLTTKVNFYFNNAGTFSSVTSTDWTFSLYVKRADGGSVKASDFGGGYIHVTSTRTVVPILKVYEVGNGWYRIILSRSTDTPDSVTLVGLTGLDMSTGWYIDGWQLEAKKYATAYVPSNSGTAEFKIPFILTPTFTINLWHRSSKTHAVGSINQNASPMIFQLGAYYTNASISFWNYNGAITIYAKGDTGSGWAGSSNILGMNSATWDHEEHMYTFVMIDSLSYKVYVDGIPSSIQTLNTQLTNLNGKLLHLGQSMPNATYRNLSMYNRVLSDEEVVKLYGSKMNFDSNGNITDTLFKEEASPIPADSIYFPLGSDALTSISQRAIISPSKEENLVYEDGAVWGGAEVSNLITLEVGSWFAEVGATISPTGEHYLGSEVYKVTFPTGGNPRIYMKILTSGIFSGSFFAKLDRSTINETTYFYLRQVGFGSLYGSATVNLSHEWQRFTITNITCPENFMYLIYQPTSTIPTTVFYITAPMLEQNGFNSPFTKTTRGRSRLEYNLNRDYGINWNADWSIVYWKKAVGTKDADLLGYSIDSLGSNSNTVGGGYLWWGKSGGSNGYRVGSGTAGDIVPSGYFNNWHMISLVKIASTIRIIAWNPDGKGNKSGATVIGIVPENYFVTPFGYDLKLGGYDGGAMHNLYFRDLIVSKRAFTDAELNSLANTQIRSKKDRLVVSGILNESVKLL